MEESKEVEAASASILLVVGAGPKALALATKAAVLRRLNLPAPHVVVIEKDCIAAAWDGKHGFTDGSPRLGTPPDKDVGYPYRSYAWGAKLNWQVDDGMGLYSWQRYLIMSGRYMGWIDRGRPQPRHSEWAEYLCWVANQVDLDIRLGVVKSLDIKEDKWVLRYEAKAGAEAKDEQNSTGGTADLITVVGDGLVITGLGEPRTPTTKAGETRHLDPITFWMNPDVFEDKEFQRIAIIGAGETAAAIACAVLDRVDEISSSVEIISPHGAIYSRGESYSENKRFSDPTGWQTLSISHRKEFINRTDRGVFSQHAQQRINVAGNIQPVPGRADTVLQEENSVTVMVRYGDEVQPHQFDYVIDTTSVNPIWFVERLGTEARNRISRAVGQITPETLEGSIDEYLSVGKLKKPALHLPLFAAINEGPGFPNLSCLGLLSDRILHLYIRSTVDTGGNATNNADK